jgi:threonine dehydratase
LNYVDDIVTVEEEEIASAILLLAERSKIIAEGAGATPVAAMMGPLKNSLEGKKAVALISGGNIDINLFMRILERSLKMSVRLLTVTVILPDSPGSLVKLTTAIAESNCNIMSVQHKRIGGDYGIGYAEVEVEVEILSHEALQLLKEKLKENNFMFKLD